MKAKAETCTRGGVTYTKDSKGLWPWQYNPNGKPAATAQFTKAQLKRFKESMPSPAILAGLGKSPEGTASPRAKRSAPVALPPLDAKLKQQIEKAYAKHSKQGTCAAIRSIAPDFDDVLDIIRALPELNPSTIRIQWKKGKAK